jgi:hypothetical protein
MLMWFVLAGASVLFVAIGVRTTPESPVMKWGFVLVTVFIGVIGAFLYVLGCLGSRCPARMSATLPCSGGRPWVPLLIPEQAGH